MKNMISRLEHGATGYAFILLDGTLWREEMKGNLGNGRWRTLEGDVLRFGLRREKERTKRWSGSQL